MNWGHWWTEHAESIITLLIGGLLGALANWFFYRRAEKPKRFAWEFRSLALLIQADKAHRKLGLKVSYADNEVTEPNVITIRLGNRGRKPIVSDDFTQGGIFFDFGETRILTGDVIGNPWTVQGAIDIETDHLCILKLPLLKRGQWVDLQFVTDGVLKPPKISPYFVGDEFQVGADYIEWHGWIRLAGGILAVIGVILGIVLADRGLLSPLVPIFVAAIYFATVGVGTFVDRRRRKIGGWQSSPARSS